ncbi:C1orf228 [Bugula neritina]|uniref:C1orf228 n=1 Tax=Bugula neritina TaxID=10212 RepID=A0A7J7JNG1_BUGNE|nr:C1orf228 [Bugula neritina]
MGSAKQQTAVSKVMNLLHEWDRGSKAVRHKILLNFIEQNKNKTGPELDSEFAEAASLFLTRLTAWLRLTYMIGTSLTQQLQAITIFVSSSSGHKFLSEFIEVGGVLTLLEILGLKQSKEIDKTQAILLLQCVADAGRKYKELICESYGIRAVAECLAKSKSDQTQDTAKNLLLSLAEGNPRFCQQVYKGLIALLPCSSPKAQQMAAQCLLKVQPMIENAHPSIVEPLLSSTRTLHLEVQYEAIQLILLLMNYSVRDKLLEGLIRSLKPNKEDILSGKQPEILKDANKSSTLAPPLPIYVQQAAAAKCIL